MDKKYGQVVITPSQPYPQGVSVGDVVEAIQEQVGMTTLIGKHLLMAQGVSSADIEALLRKYDL